MKKIILITLSGLIFMVFKTDAQTSIHGQVIVHPENRYLMYEDGTPFFWLGDTGWSLFHRLSLNEVRMYLKDRAYKGFTVIQAALLMENGGITTPNAYGEYVFKDDTYTVPNEKYFTHVDKVIDIADSLGMVIGFLPTWGDKFNKLWGSEPVLFTTTEKAEEWGQYVGNRYKDRKNIIWILGGDRPAEGFEHIIRAMAKGIATGITGKEDYSKMLMTYHSWGGTSSSKWFDNTEPWIDFNMWQTGHPYDVALWDMIKSDYDRIPAKPVIDGEPLYDEHPIDFKREKLGTSTGYHVRRFFYHNVFSGAFGHTYGVHAVWQFWDPGKRSPINGPIRSWQESLSLESSYQMGYGKELIMSRPYFTRIPDNSFIEDVYDGHDRITATRDKEGTYAMIYSESGRSFKVLLNSLGSSGRGSEGLDGWWFDPRSGRVIPLVRFNRTRKGYYHEFTPPTNGKGNDWILVLDDPRCGYPAPGNNKKW